MQLDKANHGRTQNNLHNLHNLHHVHHHEAFGSVDGVEAPSRLGDRA